MKITLEMLGAMKKPLGQGPVEVEVPDGATVGELMIEKLGYAPGHVDLLAYYVNGEKAKPSAVLTTGCRLKVLMIIGGG
jgi:sulfur carrier protein ThiS